MSASSTEERLAELETELARLKRLPDEAHARVPEPPPMTQLSRGIYEAQERKRLARAAEAERAAEAAALRARADAPKQAKRDAQIRELDERARDCQQQMSALSAELADLHQQRLALLNRPL